MDRKVEIRKNRYEKLLSIPTYSYFSYVRLRVQESFWSRFVYLSLLRFVRIVTESNLLSNRLPLVRPSPKKLSALLKNPAFGTTKTILSGWKIHYSFYGKTPIQKSPQESGAATIPSDYFSPIIDYSTNHSDRKLFQSKPFLTATLSVILQ